MDFSFGHCPHFFLLIPIVISPVGYFLPFYSLCTQNISSLWVFPSLFSLCTQNISSLWVFPSLSSPLYPKHFIFLGISFTFLSSVPKIFHLFGYFLHFLLLCTQSYFFSWVYRLVSSPYTQNAMIHVHTMAYRRSVFRLTHTRRILLFGIFRLRRVASTT